MSKQSILALCIRYIKFAASTLAGTAVDMFVLWLCSDVILPKTYWAEYLLAPFLSFECAVLTNFTIAYFFVWKDRISHVSQRSYWRHFGGYNLSCVSAFLLKMAILLLWERAFHWDVLLCNIVALCFSGLLNFFLNEQVVFSKKRLPKPQEENLENEAE